MLVQEVFDQVVYMHCNGLNIKEKNAIKPIWLKTFFMALNSALKTVHTELPLKYKELTIRQYEHISDYLISKEYTESQGDPSNTLYIKDKFEPYQDDIILIMGITDEFGNSIPLNNPRRINSIFTPSYNMITVPVPESENTIFINYKANHKFIEINEENLQEELDISPILLDPICYLIASKLYATQNNDNTIQVSSIYSNRYKAYIDKLKVSGAFASNKPNLANYKRKDNGFI